MKKDYISVPRDVTGQEEIQFVNDFWSTRWEGKRISDALIDSVTHREEYRIMIPYLNELGSSAKVLDGGCGLGEWTVFLSSLKFNVHGMDISASTIERLKKHFPNEKFMVGDIRKTGFPDGYFDAYFSWGAFEHFEDGIAQCIEEARRVIKLGGYLFVTVPFHNERHWNADNRAYRRSFSGSLDVSCTAKMSMRFYQWRLTRFELMQELVMHGFKTLSIMPIQKSEGLSRFAYHTFGIKPGTRIHCLAQTMLGFFVTRNYVAHMLMAIGQRL
jgi:ubiquinone/menaquinone biosynthesis C-methylase UbiE